MLWVVAGCFAGAALTAVLAPLLLTVGRWQLLHPRSALTAWFGAFALGITLLTTGLATSLFGAIAAPAPATAVESLMLTGTAWIGLAALGAVTAFVMTSAEPFAARAESLVSPLGPLVRSREERPGFTLVRLESAEPFAYAAPGRHPQIFISSALEHLLTTPQLCAVVAHEYAHLRQHHGGAARIAHVNAMLLAQTRPGKALQRATALLIELAADDAAARQAGAANLANALVSLAAQTGEAGLTLRAERLTNKRWPRPARRRPPAAIHMPAFAAG